MNAAGRGFEASGLSRRWKLAPPTSDESGDIKHGEKRGAKRATAQEWPPESAQHERRRKVYLSAAECSFIIWQGILGVA